MSSVRNNEKSEAPCLARSVATALSENPGLEAVTIDTDQHKVKVATLGQADVGKLTNGIQKAFERAQNAETSPGCGLLAGQGDCTNCSHPLPEARDHKITVTRDKHSTTIARVTCPTAPSFWRWRDIPLPKVVPREVEFLEDDHDLDEWKPQLAAAALCGVLAIGGAVMHGNPAVSMGLYLAAYLAGGWFTVHEVWERLQQGAIDVHFLMLAVAAGAAAIGAWGEGATLLFLFSFSGALEHYALGRTQREIRSLFRDAPKTGTVLDTNDHETEVPVERLAPGMRLLVKPGAQFPVDGDVIKGKTACDESNLTGEAVPVEKSVGDRVLGGTMNLWGAVEVQVLRGVEESSLKKIIRLIREAQQQKAPAQQFTDKFSAYYTYVVLAGSAAMFFVWWLAFGYAPFKGAGDQASAFYRTMTLLVVASPCALVLSIPSAVLAAIAWGARHGVLFRGGAAVEKLAGVTTVALDKTGTLTTGELRVETVESYPPGREREVAELAWSIERLSSHPLARAITRYGKQAALSFREMNHLESVTGHGLKATCAGVRYLLGKREWLESENVLELGLTPQRSGRSEEGVSEIWLAGGGLLGRITLRDDIRPESREVVQALRSEGLRTVVLTGDRRVAAAHLASQLQLDEVKAELRPEQKLEEIRAYTGSGARVAMIGDGVNDAPSLAAAHIGVAMGARGADAALEQADVVLMHDKLENFLAAFRLSQRARRVIRQNLIISLGTVVVLVSFALFGKIPLTIGVVGHEGSTVLVVMNSLRLLFSARSRRQPG